MRKKKAVKKPSGGKYKHIKKTKGGYTVGKKRKVKVKSLKKAKKIDKIKAIALYAKNKGKYLK